MGEARRESNAEESPLIRGRCQQQGREWTEGVLTPQRGVVTASPFHLRLPLLQTQLLLRWGPNTPGTLIRRPQFGSPWRVGRRIPVLLGTVVAATACGPLSCISPWAAFPPVPAPRLPSTSTQNTDLVTFLPCVVVELRNVKFILIRTLLLSIIINPSRPG